MTQPLLEAKLAGREAGRLNLAAGLNPYPDRSIEALAWETERLRERAAIALRQAQALERVDCARCRWRGLRCQAAAGACPECGLAL